MVIREQRVIQQPDQAGILAGVLGADLHAKRVASLCDATLGVLHGASLAVCTIGHGLAAARGLNSKHATKQVDRLLSNPNINVDDILARWVPYIVGARNSIVVALDWTDFDADKQATIMLSLITDHGRATPLVWLTVHKRTLKDNRSLYEHRVLVRLAELAARQHQGVRGRRSRLRRPETLPGADRGIVLRLRHPLPRQQRRHRRDRRNPPAAAWVPASGRARVLRAAAVTADRYPVGTVVCVQDPDMKQAWCLAASSTDATAKHLIGYYGRRWGIECGLRDTKDLRFGMGMGVMHVKSPERRDRLWLINAFAVVLLTLLGAAGEALGYDRMLKTNTAKRRVHSLFRQGCMLYDLIPTMPETRLRPLTQRFAQMPQNQPLFADLFGPV